MENLDNYLADIIVDESRSESRSKSKVMTDGCKARCETMRVDQMNSLNILDVIERRKSGMLVSNNQNKSELNPVRKGSQVTCHSVRVHKGCLGTFPGSVS